MSYTYDISIIIVNYNVRHFVVECLESFKRSRLAGLRVEVFMVDNASIDGSVDVISEQYPEVKVIANKDNVGFSKANNQAIKKSQGKYVLLLNPDTVLEEDTLKKCYDHMEVHPAVGALGVRMIDGAGIFLPESKRALPTAWNSTTKLTGLSSLFPRSKFFNGYALGHLSENQQHSIQVLCGAFMFMPMATLDKVGLLDERFFMYGEDIDLSYRILKGGYEVHYIPDTTIIHYKGESTKKGSLNYVKTFYNAMGLYVDKHYTGSGGVMFGRFLKMGIWLRASVSAARRLISNILPMIFDGALLFGALYAFSQLWAQYYFKDNNYYDGTSLSWNIGLYATIWVLIGWLIGYYKKARWSKRVQTVLIGLVSILGLYGLLDESYRTSRVIILAGTILAYVVMSLTALIRGKSRADSKQKQILIVAEQTGAETILKQLKESKSNTEVVGLVYPKDEVYDNNIYVNNISQINQLSKVLKADEIIFSTEDMTTKEIMKTMVKLDSKLSFKIAGDESLNILGSKSKNTSGEIYDVDLQYNLNTEYHQHTKRVFDVVFALVYLILFPVTMVINKLNIVKWARATWTTFIGQATWVGYNSEEINNLPKIKKCVFENTVGDRTYARNYTVWLDLETLISAKFILPADNE